MTVDQFLYWITTADADQRREMAQTLALASLDAELDVEAFESAEAMLTVLLDDPSPMVRQALAEELADTADSARHIVHALAHDLPDIAAIVLSRSPVFLDCELVDLVATSDGMVQRAIAGRQAVSSSLAAAIAEVGSADACVALVRNRAAVIAPFSLTRIVERFGDDGHVRDALLARPNVPIEIRQSLVALVTAELGSMVVTRSWMRAERAEILSREACDKATIGLAAAASPGDITSLVEHLKNSGQLTTTLLLRAICSGHFSLFEQALASLCGLPLARVQALLADGRAASFRALYGRAKLPERAFTAFVAAVEVHRELMAEVGEYGVAFQDDFRFPRRMMERIVERYQSFDPDELDDLLVLLRRFAADTARDAARKFAARQAHPWADGLKVIEPPEPIETEAVADEADWADGEIEPFMAMASPAPMPSAPGARIDPLDKLVWDFDLINDQRAAEQAEAKGEAVAA